MRNVMKAISYYLKMVSVVMFSFVPCLGSAQNEQQQSAPYPETAHLTTFKTRFYDLRGTNALDGAIGSAIINGDYTNPKFEIYTHLGYKRHLSPYLALDVGYHKFNLAFEDEYNQGFMSFDLNLELTLFPHHRCSPFIAVGAGYNASNYFKATATKLQTGAGIEYIVSNG